MQISISALKKTISMKSYRKQNYSIIIFIILKIDKFYKIYQMSKSPISWEFQITNRIIYNQPWIKPERRSQQTIFHFSARCLMLTSRICVIHVWDCVIFYAMVSILAFLHFLFTTWLVRLTMSFMSMFSKRGGVVCVSSNHI